MTAVILVLPVNRDRKEVASCVVQLHCVDAVQVTWLNQL